MHLKGIVHAVNSEAALVDEVVDSGVALELQLLSHVGVLSAEHPVEDVVVALDARKLVRHTRLLQQVCINTGILTCKSSQARWADAIF